MRVQQAPQPGRQPWPWMVSMLTPAVVTTVMVVTVAVSAGMRLRVTHDPQHGRGTLLQHLDHSGTQAPATTSRRPAAGFSACGV